MGHFHPYSEWNFPLEEWNCRMKIRKPLKEWNFRKGALGFVSRCLATIGVPYSVFLACLLNTLKVAPESRRCYSSFVCKRGDVVAWWPDTWKLISRALTFVFSLHEIRRVVTETRSGPGKILKLSAKRSLDIVIVPSFFGVFDWWGQKNEHNPYSYWSFP